MSAGRETAAGTWAALPYPDRLRLIHRLTVPAIESAVASLGLAPGSLGLDAGCGAGTHACVLTRATGPEGRVVGLDISLENLLAVPASAAPVSTRREPARVRGDVLRLPFAEHSFDWVWCADTLWPDVVAGSPVGAVRELVRVVRPGGTVAVVLWAGQTLLPGHPELEARLRGALAERMPFMAELDPGRGGLAPLAWLTDAGLVEVSWRTFVAEVRAPLSAWHREALAGCFEMLWGEILPRLGAADRRAVRRLCTPRSPRCVLDEPGYRAAVTYTVFIGTRRRR